MIEEGRDTRREINTGETEQRSREEEKKKCPYENAHQSEWIKSFSVILESFSCCPLGLLFFQGEE